MKKKIFCLSMCVFCSVCSLVASDLESLVVKKNGNTEDVFALSAIKKITFSMDTMNVFKSNNAKTQISFIDIQKSLFGVRSVNVQLIPDNSLKVYPVPATDYLYLDGVTTSGYVFVFNTSGALIPVKSVNEQGRVKLIISSLPKGTYLLTINNQSVKFLKK